MCAFVYASANECQDAQRIQFMPETVQNVRVQNVRFFTPLYAQRTPLYGFQQFAQNCTKMHSPTFAHSYVHVWLKQQITMNEPSPSHNFRHRLRPSPALQQIAKNLAGPRIIPGINEELRIELQLARVEFILSLALAGCTKSSENGSGTVWRCEEMQLP